MRLLVPLLALLPSALVLAAPAGKSPLPRATEVTTVKGRTITIRSDAKEPTKFDSRLSLSILDVLSISCPKGAMCLIADQTAATVGVFEKGVEERTKLGLSTVGPESGSTDKYGYTVRIEGATLVKVPASFSKIAVVKPDVYLVKLTVFQPTPERIELLRNKQMWVAARKGRAYSMVEARQCRCTEATRGPVQLQINADGSLIGTYVVGDLAGKSVDANLLLGSEQVFFSIDQLFDNASQYLTQGASVQIQYSKTLGYPVSFRFDLNPQIADDEFVYTVADVAFSK